MKKNERVDFLGTLINNLTLEETIFEIEDVIKNRRITQHVVLNASKTVLMQSHNKLKEIINNCSLINADGQSIVWASKILGKPLKERVAGIDLMQRLVEVSEKKEYSIYFFGAKEEVVKKVVEIYKKKYPNLKIAGYRNGYFSKEENKEVVEDIKISNADILFVAFSSPKKEYWLAENIEKLNVPFCMGVGGSFDVVAGITNRAPILMQKYGLEWFYRLIQEPRRMWRRYLIGNLKFCYYVIKELLKLNKTKQK
jgi:N-acetylglucosaminyldiphosphoundecaprenol N-acetyl-beta-D-mannosaminyltransferase